MWMHNKEVLCVCCCACVYVYQVIRMLNIQMLCCLSKAKIC